MSEEHTVGPTWHLSHVLKAFALKKKDFYLFRSRTWRLSSLQVQVILEHVTGLLKSRELGAGCKLCLFLSWVGILWESKIEWVSSASVPNSRRREEDERAKDVWSPVPFVS